MFPDKLLRELPAAVTVCDAAGVILEMNERSARMFREEGGWALVGKSVLDCHPPEARAKLEGMMRERRPNAYTIEKQGKRKLIWQSPWYREGEYAGFVEIALDIPGELPHFKRD